MKKFGTLIFFLLANFIGFNAGLVTLTIIYSNPKILENKFAAAGSGQVDSVHELFANEITLVTACWMACALFSFAVFFIRGFWRMVFLLAPIIMPVLAAFMALQPYF